MTIYTLFKPISGPFFQNPRQSLRNTHFVSATLHMIFHFIGLDPTRGVAKAAVFVLVLPLNLSI